ncbi:MAG: hypothetical protein K8R91_05895, partial [Phycisphaerae bacterium]|nr:hypothetical protein [Phycisphaerae bacterium]
MQKCILVALVSFFLTASSTRPATDWNARYAASEKKGGNYVHNWKKKALNKNIITSNLISWAWSPTLRGYEWKYKTGGETIWLDKMVTSLDAWISHMRDVPAKGVFVHDEFWTGYKDGFKGWGTTDYDPQNRYQEYMVHDGTGAEAIAKFVEIVYYDKKLHPKYKIKADEYLRVLEDHIVAKWYKNWKSDRYPGEGTGIDLQRWGGYRKTRVPNNQYLTFTSFLWVMHSIANSPPYKVRRPEFVKFYYAEGTGMLEYFKSVLKYDAENDAYDWAYLGPLKNRSEHLGYAGMDCRAVIEGYLRGSKVFSEKEMKRFANTFLRVMWNKDADNPS